ncbi:hypothetical protein ACFFIF_03035 [Vagococcus entomophilus]|uniref:Uncharacterized protein n=1 Tax=Vagococcus entomophilus TaxID=1160095 RepID=A0A430AJE4_9ENTE|nr:hypothetical protein [Vagococcus entomophilus]RSU08236.1 hypothetical protein CBF30_03060 [Vagococcus entomophilus]
MEDFEIDLPKETSLLVNVTDKNLYNYDFSSYSLLPLQKIASKSITAKIKDSLFSNISQISLIEKLSNQKETEYVARISNFAKDKINSGEWSFGIRKETGETYAVIKDNLSGKNKSFVTLDKRIIKDLGVLPELSAIQGQLASISEQIEGLNQIIQRVEKGQYNDRYAGFFSARQLVVEGLASENESNKRELLISAIKIANETISKLMISIHEDSALLIDSKTKSKDARRIDNLLQTSLGYLNSTVQLNLIAYTALGEKQALFATMTNYHSFIEQVLMNKNENGKTVAWLLDNAHMGDDGRIQELTNAMSANIEVLLATYNKERVDVIENEKIENKDL